MLAYRPEPGSDRRGSAKSRGITSAPAGVELGAGQQQVDGALQPREVGGAHAVGMGALHAPSRPPP